MGEFIVKLEHRHLFRVDNGNFNMGEFIVKLELSIYNRAN